MKKYIFYLCTFWLFLSMQIFVACMDIEEYPDGRIDFKEIFGNSKKTAGFLNDCYSALHNYGDNYDKQMLAGCTDEAEDVMDVQNGIAYRWHKGSLSPYNNPLNCAGNPESWNHYYSGIRLCNIFLAHIDTANVLSETERGSFRAQAFALRAFYYLQLVKHYGGVFLITKELSDDYDYSDMRRASFSECARQIISDCNNALKASDDEFMWHSGTIEADRGKMSKGIVYAIMSEVALYAASPLFNDGSFTWKEASYITGVALNECLAHGYDLYKSKPSSTDGYGPYDVYFYTRSDVSGLEDKETIMEGKNQLQMWQYSGLPTTLGQSRAGICPSQELIDSYETISGVAPVLGYKDENHLQPIINPDATDYNEADPYANRDPRLKASVYYHGALINLHKTETVSIAENGNCALSATSVRNSRTGYYVRKFSHFDSNRTANKDGYFKVFRLAELYLNYAEAMNEAKENGIAPTEAVDALNVIRSRVGMPPIPPNMSCDDFRLRVRNERRVELAFEEHRFFDVRRWKVLNETDKVITGMKVVKKDNGNVEFERFIVDNHRKAWDTKYLLFPLPGDEVIRLKNKTGIDYQNPNW